MARSCNDVTAPGWMGRRVTGTTNGSTHMGTTAVLTEGLNPQLENVGGEKICQSLNIYSLN